MGRKIDLDALEQRLKKEKEELALQIGSNMIDKQGIKTYSAYKGLIKQVNQNKMLDPISEIGTSLPGDIKQQALIFQKQLEEWTEDNWGNKLDYKTFYPELLDFFRKLNSLE